MSSKKPLKSSPTRKSESSDVDSGATRRSPTRTSPSQAQAVKTKKVSVKTKEDSAGNVENTTSFADEGASNVFDSSSSISSSLQLPDQEIDKKSDIVSVKSEGDNTENVDTECESVRPDRHRTDSISTATVCGDSKSTTSSPTHKIRTGSSPISGVHRGSSSPGKAAKEPSQAAEIRKKSPPANVRKNLSPRSKGRDEALSTEQDKAETSTSGQQLRQISPPRTSPTTKSPRKTSPSTIDIRREATLTSEGKREIPLSVTEQSPLALLQKEPTPSDKSHRQTLPVGRGLRSQSLPAKFRKDSSASIKVPLASPDNRPSTSSHARHQSAPIELTRRDSSRTAEVSSPAVILPSELPSPNIHQITIEITPTGDDQRPQFSLEPPQGQSTSTGKGHRDTLPLIKGLRSQLLNKKPHKDASPLIKSKPLPSPNDSPSTSGLHLSALTELIHRESVAVEASSAGTSPRKPFVSNTSEQVLTSLEILLGRTQTCEGEISLSSPDQSQEESTPTGKGHRETLPVIRGLRSQSISKKSKKDLSPLIKDPKPSLSDERPSSSMPIEASSITVKSSKKLPSPNTHQRRSPTQETRQQITPTGEGQRPQTSSDQSQEEPTPIGQGRKETLPLIKGLRSQTISKKIRKESSPSVENPETLSLTSGEHVGYLSGPTELARRESSMAVDALSPTVRSPRQILSKVPPSTQEIGNEATTSPPAKGPKSLCSPKKTTKKPTPTEKESSAPVKSPRPFCSSRPSTSGHGQLSPSTKPDYKEPSITGRAPSPTVKMSGKVSSPNKIGKISPRRESTPSGEGYNEPSSTVTGLKQQSSPNRSRVTSPSTNQIRHSPPIQTHGKVISPTATVRGQPLPSDKSQKITSPTSKFPSASSTPVKGRRPPTSAVKGPREQSPISAYRKVSLLKEKIVEKSSVTPKLRKEAVKDNKDSPPTEKDSGKKLSPKKYQKDQKDKEFKSKKIDKSHNTVKTRTDSKKLILASEEPHDQKYRVGIDQSRIDLTAAGEGRIDTLDSVSQIDEINSGRDHLGSIGAGEGHMDAVGNDAKETAVLEAKSLGSDAEKEELIPTKELSVIYEVTETDTECDRDREEEARQMEIDEMLSSTNLTEVDLLRRHHVLMVHVVYDGEAEDTYFQECTMLVKSKTPHFRIVTNDCARKRDAQNTGEREQRSIFNRMSNSITGFFRNPAFLMRSVAAAITSYRQNRGFQPTLIFVDAHPIVIPMLKLAFSCPVISFAFYQEVLLRKECGIMAPRQMVRQAFSNYCLRRADEIFVPSFSVGKKYLQQVNNYNYCPHVLFPPVIENLIVNEHATPLPNIFRPECDQPIYFLIIGPWDPKANFHFALSALDYFYTTLVTNENHKDRFVFLFIGYIDNKIEKSVKYRNEVCELIQLLPVAFRRCIRIINNPSHQQMCEYYRKCIAVINLTQVEDFNWTIMECHYFGRPLITLKSPFSSEVIENGFNGFILDPVSIKFAQHLYFIYSWIGQHFFKCSSQFFADNFSRAQRSRVIKKVMLKHFPLTDDETFE